jgi:glycosyltransferase involved in cell wall biosynthesis
LEGPALRTSSSGVRSDWKRVFDREDYGSIPTRVIPSERHVPHSGEPLHEPDDAIAPEAAPPPTLSVVVPVFNQASSIVDNLEVIRNRLLEAFGESFEIVVVSDGSIDETEAALLAKRGAGGFRVFHYDRNLGKGYAVKLGALEAFGDWIGFVDADLDLDPGDLASYVRHAQERELDFAIGSKRHPDSQVYYPRSRVVASWCFQQLVRLLFRLDVTDTQVGLKVFRREVAEQVLPLLLVKRYAFDIELLVVARAFGFDRIEELPIRLEYRFTGSGVRSRAVLRALVDTAAIFYRLRLLRYYQRRRAIAGPFGWTRPRTYAPLVSVLVPPGAHFRPGDYPNVEILNLSDASIRALRAAAEAAQGEVLAVLEPGGRASANWLASTVPFLGRPELTAIVSPKVAPLEGPVLERAAAAIDESRIGAGLGYFRFTPGNVRFVDDFPALSFVVRRDSFLALPEDIGAEEVVSAVTDASGRALYTPDSVIVVAPPRLFRPHLRSVFATGRHRGRALRRGHVSWRRASLGVPAIFAVAVIVFVGSSDRELSNVVIAIVVSYALIVGLASVAGALRFQSAAVGILASVGIVLTHATYLAGFGRGLVGPRS